MIKILVLLLAWLVTSVAFGEVDYPVHCTTIDIGGIITTTCN